MGKGGGSGRTGLQVMESSRSSVDGWMGRLEKRVW